MKRLEAEQYAQGLLEQELAQTALDAQSRKDLQATQREQIGMLCVKAGMRYDAEDKSKSDISITFDHEGAVVIEATSSPGAAGLGTLGKFLCRAGDEWRLQGNGRVSLRIDADSLSRDLCTRVSCITKQGIVAQPAAKNGIHRP